MRSIRFNRCGERRRAIALALIAGATLSLPFAPPSRAAGGDEERNAAATSDEVSLEARRLSARGLAHFEAGRYDDAIADFIASYRIVPLPGLLYNLAQAYRLKGDCARSVGAYRGFLATNPPGKIRQKAEARIAELAPRCPAAPPPPASPAAAAPTPIAVAPPAPAAPAPVAPAPGPASAPSPPTAASAASTALARSLTVAAPPPSPLRASGPRLSPRTRRWFGGAGFGLAAVASGIFSVHFAAQSLDAAGDVSAVMHVAGTWDAVAMHRQETGLRDEKIALLFGAGALVSAALSVWLIVRRGGG